MFVEREIVSVLEGDRVSWLVDERENVRVCGERMEKRERVSAEYKRRERTHSVHGPEFKFGRTLILPKCVIQQLQCVPLSHTLSPALNGSCSLHKANRV